LYVTLIQPARLISSAAGGGGIVIASSIGK
jgi:hypothetical protein